MTGRALAGGPLQGEAPAAMPIPRRLRNVLCLEEFEAAAQRHLPRPVFQYVAGGVEDGISLRRNREVFAEIELIPRYFGGVARRSAETSLFGRSYAAPFGIAPTGFAALSGYRGDIAMAAAARAAGIPMMLSGASFIRMEDAHAAGDIWFQAYLPNRFEIARALMDRAAGCGIGTLVITADTPVKANRENNVRAGFSIPFALTPSLVWQGISHPRWLFGTYLRTLARHGPPHFENHNATRGRSIFARDVAGTAESRAHVTWALMQQVRDYWKGRLVIKGLLSVEDAIEARAAGFDGIVVSNHGGRQLDTVVSPMRVLAAMRRALPDMPLMMDSGIRRGTDVLKALALGADFVFIGRPFNYASALAGQPGVAYAIELLRREILADMGMLGINSPAEMSIDFLRLRREDFGL